MNINVELWYVVVMAVSGTLFALGGTQISDTIKGQKWLRRFLLPVLLGLFCLFVGHFIWWRCLILTFGFIIAFHLGYGHKVPYWRKILSAIMFTLPTLALWYFSPWQVITPVLFILLFWLSNLKWMSNYFVWKICEFLVGSFIGITIVSLTHLHMINP